MDDSSKKGGQSHRAKILNKLESVGSVGLDKVLQITKLDKLESVGHDILQMTKLDKLDSVRHDIMQSLKSNETITQDFSKKYGQYCRPKLLEKLQAIRLDKVYYKAERDFLFYKDENGEEVKVIDFVGGFGASLFGHNNPELIEVAVNNFKNLVPFVSQGSCRSRAALLCEKLNQMMFARTKRNYVITLASTGAEVVEAALKHSELYQHKRIEELDEELTRFITFLIKKYKDSDFSVSADFHSSLEDKLNIEPKTDLFRRFWGIKSYNSRILNQKPVFICLKRSFHGKTTGAVKMTYHDEYRIPFYRIGIDVVFVNSGDEQQLADAIKNATATYYWPEINMQGEICLSEKKFTNVSGIFIEPIQGEGGINIVPREFLQFCRSIATKHKIPLIFDEIQCGMGRTGTFLFSEQQGVVADYYLLSKSLGGGISKISALLIDKAFYKEKFGEIHSSTFAEDDHSANIAFTALNILDRNDDLMQNCVERGNQLIHGIENLKLKYPKVIKEVRGIGLMIGIEFHEQRNFGSGAITVLYDQDLLGYIIAGYLLHEHGFRIFPTISNNAVIRLEPSAYISENKCNQFLSALDRLCEIIQKQNSYELMKFIVGAKPSANDKEIESYRKEIKPYIKPLGARKVALTGNFISASDLRLWDKSFSKFTNEELDHFFEKLYRILDPVLYDQFTVESVTKEKVSVNFIDIMSHSRIITKHMRNGDTEIFQDKIQEAVKLAEDHGCQIMGFGAFTSIITNNCKSLFSDMIGLTSGNSFTVGMGVKAIYKGAEDMGIDLSNACFGAIGANGNIGSIFSEIIAMKVPRILLVSRPGKEDRLVQVAADIYESAFEDILKYSEEINSSDKIDKSKIEKRWCNFQQRFEDPLMGVARAIFETKAISKLLREYNRVDKIGKWLFETLSEELKDQVPIIITSDFGKLKECNLILGASNSPDPLIFPEMLGQMPIVICDIAVPMDTDSSVKKLTNALVIQGGLVRLPCNPDVQIAGVPLEPGVQFACMAEAILLGLSGVSGHYSYGRITKSQVQRIMQIAQIHGFDLAKFKTQSGR